MSAPTHPRTPSFFSCSGPFLSPGPLQDDDVSVTTSVSSTSLSSALATSITLQDQHRLDASTRARLHLGFKKSEPKRPNQGPRFSTVIFQQWRAYFTAGGTKSLASLGLHLSADPDKLQDSTYFLRRDHYGYFSSLSPSIPSIQRLDALFKCLIPLNPSIVPSSLTIF